MGSENYESMAEELRKDEKKLGVSILTFLIYFYRTSSKSKKKCFLLLSTFF